MRDAERSKAELIGELEAVRQRLSAAESALRKQHGATAPQHESEEKYRQLFEMASDAVLLIDNSTGEILEVNPAATALYGYSRHDLLEKNYTELSAEPEQTRLAMREHRLRVPLRFHRKRDGTVLPVEVTSRYLIWQGRDVQVAAVRDISERVAAEGAMQRTARALKALSQCNHVLVHAAREPELLAEICQIIVETAGYRLAWVGFAEQDEHKTVRPVAQAGFEEGYLETVNVNWADTERGRGPTGTSIRTAAPCVIKDIPTDPRFSPWRAEATRRGYASCAGLPLLAEGKALGAITVYAPEPHAFDLEELNLLMDLADNLAYGMGALRTREALKKSHEELEKRVQQRTAELASLNVQLFKEIDERKQTERAVQKEQKLLRRLLSIHEQERQVLAYEIHDGFVQEATAALMRLQALKEQYRGRSKAAQKSLDTATELLTQGIAEARRLIGGLRPPVLDESGVVAAIEFLVGEEKRQSAAEIDFQSHVRFDRLSASAETALFRIVQESLTNARRHSHSPKVHVELTQKGRRLHLLVEDWGTGFDMKKIPKDRFGLRGIRERARLLGGRAAIDSAPGKGTRIRVELPIVVQAAEDSGNGRQG